MNKNIMINLQKIKPFNNNHLIFYNFVLHAKNIRFLQEKINFQQSQYDYQELKNKYTSENYSTSQEILLTFQHIMNLITHINDQKKLYDINIPFKNIRLLTSLD